MADLTSLYRNKPKRDLSVQACVDCLNKVALLYPHEFKRGYFTDYLDISGGTQPPKSKFIHELKDGYVRFLQIRDFSSDDTPTFIPVAKNNKLCESDDILLGRYGASVGKILTGKTGAYNVACAKIIFLNKNEIDRQYLFYWLHSSYFQDSIRSITRSAQGGFNKNDLSRIKTFFPSINIQRRFVSILQTIDTAMLSNQNIDLEEYAISKIETEFIKLVGKYLSIINENAELNTEFIAQIELLKQLRQASLREAMQGKLVRHEKKDGNAKELFEQIKTEKEKLIAEKKLKKEKPLSPITSDDIPFQIPNDWVWCRLGEIAEIRRGKSPKYLESGVYKMLNQKCIRWYEVDIQYSKSIDERWYKEVNDEFKVFTNDLLVNSTGEGTIGRTAIADDSCSGFIFDSHILRIRSRVEQAFICYCINSDFGQALIEKVKGARSTKQTELGVNNLSNILIPLPPLPEQTRIVIKLNQLMQYCDDLEQSIQQSKQQNGMLLERILREALRAENN